MGRYGSTTPSLRWKGLTLRDSFYYVTSKKKYKLHTLAGASVTAEGGYGGLGVMLHARSVA